MPSPIEIADSLEPDLRKAFLSVVNAVATAVPQATLERLLEAGDIVGVLDLYERVVARSLSFPITTELAAIYGALAAQPLADALRAGGLEASFSIVSPLVIEDIRNEGAKLVVGVGQDTIASIRTIIERNTFEGLGAPYAGRLIRSVVGLLPAHAQAVVRYAESLNVPEEERTRLATTYARRLLNYRAENISRTETIRASHAGQLAGWLRMADEGVLQRERTRVEWVVTEDDRLCPWCAVMDGVTVDLGELFYSDTKGFPDGKPTITSPGGERLRQSPIKPDPRSQPRDARGRWTTRKRDDHDYLDGHVVSLKKPLIVSHPPLHPQCRCTMVLRFSS